MKTPKLIRLTFAGILLAGLSTTLPALRAQDAGGSCGGCHGSKGEKPAPSPSGGGSTNAPTKN